MESTSKPQPEWPYRCFDVEYPQALERLLDPRPTQGPYIDIDYITDSYRESLKKRNRDSDAFFRKYYILNP